MKSTLGLIIFTACLLMTIGESGKLFELSIIHFSDFHARYIPVSSSGGLCYKAENCVGGIARVAYLTRKLKQIRTNPIFLNAGDNFQGTLYYDIYRGNITAYFLNKLELDVITIGNHDFDDEISGLVSFVKELKPPTVVTNIDISEEPLMKNIYTNSTIIQKDGKSIGVIGVIYNNTNKISSDTGKLKFLDEIATVNLEAKKLKANGTNIILVLSHCGIEHDKILAQNSPDIDVIVGGHSHILLYNGKPPSDERVYGNYPIVVQQTENNRTVLIVHSSAYTKYIGDLRVVFNEFGEVSFWKGNPIYLDHNLKEDAEIIQELQPWKAGVDKIGKQYLGETRSFLNGSCSSGECTLINLITNAMVDHYSDRATISLISANSVTNSIPKGRILFEDIYMTLPYNNTWDLIELQGDDLLQVLEENVATSISNTSFVNPKLLLWSGLRVTYNLTNIHSKVVDAKVRCFHCKNESYQSLNLNKWYSIVVPSFLVTEDFEIIFKKHGKHVVGTLRDVTLMTEYIKKIKVVDVKIESRMVFI